MHTHSILLQETVLISAYLRVKQKPASSLPQRHVWEAGVKIPAVGRAFFSCLVKAACVRSGRGGNDSACYRCGGRCSAAHLTLGCPQCLNDTMHRIQPMCSCFVERDKRPTLGCSRKTCLLVLHKKEPHNSTFLVHGVLHNTCISSITCNRMSN